MTQGDEPKRVAFNRPSLAGQELEYIAQAVEGMHLSGNGPFTRRCETLLESLLEAPHVLLTTSCTHALEIAAVLLEVGPGDEVIVPSFTFVSTANAFASRGARIVFVDIREDTLNLDERLLEAAMTPRTRAIVPVHYAGVGCDMHEIMRVASRHDVVVVEDAAHALQARFSGRHLGTYGALATLSFHETKNVTCGEGGALVVNDARYLERAEIVREKGTNRTRFMRGEVPKYTWVDAGSSYVLSDILAAFLYAQLAAIDRIQAVRRRIWHQYYDGLRDWAAASGVLLPTIPSDCEQSFHMFYVALPDSSSRTALMAHLAANHIAAVTHYVPLHSSPMGRKWGSGTACPIADAMSNRLLRLPFHNALTTEDVERVIAAMATFGVGVGWR
jgi:dTDP-4-amino-4,6-dideoxygalactose transaminase